MGRTSTGFGIRCKECGREIAWGIAFLMRFHLRNGVPIRVK